MDRFYKFCGLIGIAVLVFFTNNISASASLVGDQITGLLDFQMKSGLYTGYNWFDKSSVPSGYQDYVIAGPNAVINETDNPYYEFMYSEAGANGLGNGNGINVDFDANSLYVIEFPLHPNDISTLAGWKMVFTNFDTPITGLQLNNTNIRDLTYSFTSDSITLSMPYGYTQVVGGYSANFTVITPEPTTMFFLVSGLLGIGAFRKRFKK
jgi:hypothetical protein